jgi:hypothetical protein
MPSSLKLSGASQKHRCVFNGDESADHIHGRRVVHREQLQRAEEAHGVKPSVRHPVSCPWQERCWSLWIFGPWPFTHHDYSFGGNPMSVSVMFWT